MESMQPRERNLDEDRKKERKEDVTEILIYPLNVHSVKKENHCFLIGPMETMKKVELHIEQETAKLRYLDRCIKEETIRGNRYGATRVSEQWWNRMEKLDTFLKEQNIGKTFESNIDQLLFAKKGKKEELSVEIGFDDGDTDDKEMLLAAGLTSSEKQYILNQARELRYIDAQIRDDINDGNEDALDFWHQQYRNRLSSLRWFMDRKGIAYSFRKKKDMTQEKMIAEENHQKKCPTCQHKRRASVMRSQSKERDGRSRQQSQETP